MDRGWWKIPPRPVAPISAWVLWSTWKLSLARSSPRNSRRYPDSLPLEGSGSFEQDIGLFAGNTAKAVVTLFFSHSVRLSQGEGANESRSAVAVTGDWRSVGVGVVEGRAAARRRWDRRVPGEAASSEVRG